MVWIVPNRHSIVNRHLSTMHYIVTVGYCADIESFPETHGTWRFTPLSLLSAGMGRGATLPPCRVIIHIKPLPRIVYKKIHEWYTE